MPVALRREPSRLPRPTTASTSIPRASRNQPPKTDVKKDDQPKPRQNVRPRPSTTLACTSPRSCKTSLDVVPVRSRYCLTTAADDSRKKMAAASNGHRKEERPEARPTGSFQEGSASDVMFLRKLLAMNKKQEVEINMKLVELMKNREPENTRDDRWSDKNKANCSPSKTQSGGRSAGEREIEYDLNGRRVYHFSDDENEGQNAETWIANTTTVIERTSEGGDSAREVEVSSQRQSLTVIKPMRAARRAEAEDRARKGEKLVVHCVEPDEGCKVRTKKRLLKVWNYKNLLNSGEGGEGDGEPKAAKEGCINL